MAKYSWYQTADCVCISIFVGQRLSADAIKAVLDDAGCHLTVCLGEDSLSLDLLHACSSCRVSSVGAVQATVELAKRESLSWPSLTPQAIPPGADPLRYPSSARKPANWDSIDVHEDDDDDASVDSFFKKIYDQGTDDTRRAMRKSMYESGGTVLSTNWKDVGKGQVEGRPPGK